MSIHQPLTRTLMIVMTCILLVVGLWYGLASQNPSVEQLKPQFQKAVESKDWKSAEELAARWTTIAPDSGEAWLRRAESLLQQHKFESALDCLNRVPPSSKESENAMTTAVELQFGPLNHPAEGAEICERMLTKNPRSVIAQQRLIFFLTMTLQRTRLIQQIRQAIEMGNEPRESYVYLFFVDTLSFANGTELNHQWRSSDPDSELFEVAMAIFTAELLDSSISMDDRDAAEASRRALANRDQVMDQLLAKYPHNPELLAYNIRQRIQLGDQASVVNLLAQATVEAESDHRFWRFKGWVHADRNEALEAEQAYRHALELHPMDWSTRHLLAELLQQQQQFAEVKSLRDLVTRANELRRTLQATANARQVAQDVLSRLADYAADCGDKQMSDALRKRFRQYKRS